jgi:transcriptional regulator with XRE-family HTH domain
MNKKILNLKQIGKRLKVVRITLQQTQEEIGKFCGIKHNTISDIENGNRKTHLKYLLLLAEKFKVNLNWVFTGEGPMFSDFEIKWDFGQDNKIVKELIFLLENVPSIRLQVLNYYLELKMSKNPLIEDFLSKMRTNA